MSNLNTNPVVDIKSTTQSTVGFLQSTDPDGTIVNSSKRLCGAIMLASGGIINIVLAIYSFANRAVDATTIQSCSQTLMYVGGVLLGIGIFEGIGSFISAKVSSNTAPSEGYK
jgi:hypothetical protein